MAKNEPIKPDDIKTAPETETPTAEQAAPIHEPETGGKAPGPEISAEESAALAVEGKDEKELPDTGAEQPEPPPLFDMPAPGDVVVSFDKINEIVSEKQAAAQKQEPEVPAPDKKEPKAPPAEKKNGRDSRPPKADKADKPKTDKELKADKPKADKEPKPDKPKPDNPAKQKPGAGIGGADSTKAAEKAEKAEAAQPETPPPPPEPREAPRSGEKEEIVYISLADLHPFKDHPFQVRRDDEMAAMVESVKDKGITQAAIVRPRENGGYEIVSGHRRQLASELAGFTNMPCIVRNLTDEQAITQMVEDNTTQREAILPSERAKALKMQLDAIKQQGARTGNGQRTNEIVAERNKMTVKQVQRYIKLNELTPDLMKMVDEKKIAFTPAVELAFIKPKNQRYIAVAIEGQQSAPSLSQAQRMRELDGKNLLNGDVIDGIMLEEKKEVDKVILSSQELGQYFGKEKTPREMKDTILKLLDEYKAKQPELSKPEKKTEQEK